MALSLDDKLLGEKVHNYCSSSEDEGDEDSDNDRPSSTGPSVPAPDVDDYSGHCTNTGPKGVLTDWRRFKQLENEKRDGQEKEKLQLAKKLTLTCRSHLDDEKEKNEDKQFMEEIEKELEEFEDEFLREYRQKRIEEMRTALNSVPRFGHLIQLQKDNYVESIDTEKPSVIIVVHIYAENVAACEAMNGSLSCLAQEYPTVKFCKIRASDTKLSGAFAVNGVPALLIYKNKELVGNFIRLSNEFGEDFFATDVESFLLEHGMLPDKSLSLGIIRQQNDHHSDTDSDFDVD